MSFVAACGGCGREQDRTRTSSVKAAATAPAPAREAAIPTNSPPTPVDFGPNALKEGESIEAVRVGRWATDELQHPMLELAIDKQQQQFAFDVIGPGFEDSQIIVLIEPGVPLPPLNNRRPLELKGRLSVIDLSGPEGTKDEYRNEVLRVTSWRIVEKPDQPAGAESTPVVRVGHLSEEVGQHPIFEENQLYLRVAEGERRGWDIILLFPDDVKLPDDDDRRRIEVTGTVNLEQSSDTPESRAGKHPYTNEIMRVISWRYLED